MSIEIVPLGDLAIRVSFGNEINEKIHRQINQFLRTLDDEKIAGIVECVPTYTSIAIYYIPNKISYRQLVKRIQTIYHSSDAASVVERIVYTIPVYYGGETGPDLSFVADFNHLSEQEVINIHANKEYLIYMMGFVPGFPYLGGLSKKITTPRLEFPRPKIAAGSVGIGGEQTGIYPLEVPSGWRIIGITPLTLFDLENNQPSLLSSSNYVKFSPVDYHEYLSIKDLVITKKYEVEKRVFHHDIN